MTTPMGQTPRGDSRKNGSSLEHSKFAIQLRDVIARITRKEIRLLNPPPIYGIVAGFDRANFLCGVRFPPSDDVVQVRMGAYQPLNYGQAVRVTSTGGEMFLEDVIGPGLFVGSGGSGGGGGGQGLPGPQGERGLTGPEGPKGRDGVNGFDIALLGPSDTLDPAIYNVPCLVYRYPP